MDNKESKIIEQTISFVKKTLENVESGHDWWHIYRVWSVAKTIAESENCNLFIVELGALLHDIADSKFHSGDENVGPKLAMQFMKSVNIEEEIRGHIIKIVKNISFKGGNHKVTFTSKELDVVQDADRLDAMGAIGIARTFNYGGFKNRSIYNPEIKPNLYMTKEEYKSSTAPTINHFYEKLLLLKDRMNTETGKKMAKNRHQFMEQYLEQFNKEWKGKN